MVIPVAIDGPFGLRIAASPFVAQHSRVVSPTTDSPPTDPTFLTIAHDIATISFSIILPQARMVDLCIARPSS